MPDTPRSWTTYLRCKHCKAHVLSRAGESTFQLFTADIGRQLLVYGRRIPLAELLLRLDAINIEEVKRVARERLFDKDVAVTALGPLSRMPPLAELRRRTAARRL
eukprot:g11976.t1